MKLFFPPLGVAGFLFFFFTAHNRGVMGTYFLHPWGSFWARKRPRNRVFFCTCSIRKVRSYLVTYFYRLPLKCWGTIKFRTCRGSRKKRYSYPTRNENQQKKGLENIRRLGNIYFRIISGTFEGSSHEFLFLSTYFLKLVKGEWWDLKPSLVRGYSDQIFIWLSRNHPVTQLKEKQNHHHQILIYPLHTFLFGWNKNHKGLFFFP